MAVGPLTLAIARDIVSPEQLPRAIGAVVGAASAGVTIGLLLSGFLVDRVSVTAIFWFLFVLAAVLMLATLALVPESPVQASVRIDVVGAVFLSLGMTALLLAISKGNDWGWSSARILVLFVAAFVSLTVFVMVERRVREPLIDLRLVVEPPFANANICAFAFGLAFYLAGVVVPIMAALPDESDYGLGYSTTRIGLVLLPSGLASIVSARASGRLVDRVGLRVLAISGSLFGIVAYVWFAAAHSTAVALAFGSAMLGVAWGLVLTSIYTFVIRSASTDKTGVAVAVNVVMRNIALAVGVQVAFAIITGCRIDRRFPAESGFTRVFLMGLVGACVTLLASATLMPGRTAMPHGRL